MGQYKGSRSYFYDCALHPGLSSHELRLVRPMFVCAPDKDYMQCENLILLGYLASVGNSGRLLGLVRGINLYINHSCMCYKWLGRLSSGADASRVGSRPQWGGLKLTAGKVACQTLPVREVTRSALVSHCLAYHLRQLCRRRRRRPLCCRAGATYRPLI